MPSIIQARLSKAGLSRQSAQGAYATTATYAYGVDGASILKLDLTENEFGLTWSNRDILGFDRQAIKPSQAGLGTLATPNLIGLLLFGVLGADTVVTNNTPAGITGVTVASPAVVTSVAHGLVTGQTVTIAGVVGATAVNGTWQVTVLTANTFSVPVNNTVAYTSGGTIAASYTHTLTPASVLPYMTAFGSFGTADWARIGDCKVSSVQLSWEEAGKVMIKHDLLGVSPSMLAAAYTETNLEVPTGGGYFTAGGGVFQIEGNNFALGKGQIKMDAHINQPISSASTLPADVVEGKLEVTWSLTIYPTDTSLFRGVYFGAETPGALSSLANVPRIGSLSCQFPGPFGNLLNISSPKAQFKVEFPASKPDGGPAELMLAGTSTLPLTGASTTGLLTNAVPGY